MRLQHFLGLALCLLVLPLNAALVAVPDPARLNADWWNYFSPEPQLDAIELKGRYAEADKFLAQLSAAPELAARTRTLPAIVQLRELLNSHLAARNEAAHLLEPLAAPLNLYSLEQALSRQTALLALTREIDYERDETGWRRDLTGARRSQQSQRKVAYLRGTLKGSDKLFAGLALMSSRVQLELDELNLTRRQARLEALNLQRQALLGEIKNLGDSLELKPEELAKWQEFREAAQNSVTRLSEEGLGTDSASEFADADLTNRGRRSESLRIMLRELRITGEKLRAERGELLVYMIQMESGEAGANVRLKSALGNASEHLDELIPRQKYWKSAISGANAVVAEAAGETTTIATRGRLDARDLSDAVNQAIAEISHELALLEFSINLAGQRLQLGETGFERGWMKTKNAVSNSVNEMLRIFVVSLFEVNDTPVTLLGLMRVIFILFIAWFLSRLARGAIRHLSERGPVVSQSSLYALGRVVHYLIIGIGTVIGLSSIGVDFTKFALLASALSIGIGFGLQTLVSNFVAGLIILAEKSMKVGDFVELESGLTGEVQEINMRSTLITTNDNIDILVPNSEFVNKNVTNWTMREAFRRIRVKFGVAYGSNKDVVKKAALEAADQVKWTLKTDEARLPQVWLVNFGDSSLDFELVVWLSPEAVKRPSAVLAAYLWEIETKLAEYKIEIPFPQRDLHLRSGFEVLPQKL